MVHRQAALQFQSVPTDPAQLPAFDAQIRKLYNVDEVAESVVNDAPDYVKQVCDTLAKQTFSNADRVLLLTVIESLYKPYP
jgi:hypothetical protein